MYGSAKSMSRPIWQKPIWQTSNLPNRLYTAKMIPLNKKLLCQNKIGKRCRKITACVNARLIPEGNIHSYEYSEGFKLLQGP
jgi:hypothetical protein